MVRAGFRLAVLAFLFTFASLANSALSWHLPLPDRAGHRVPGPAAGRVPRAERHLV
jgi:hypothetical protein